MNKIKLILPLLPLFFSGFYTNAQTCEGAVQNDANVISSTTELSDISKESFWICTGGMLNLGGNNCTIFVESGAELILIGDENTVYLLSNDDEDRTNEITGDNNTFYIGNGAELTLIGSNNTINAQPEADVSIIGLFNDEESCSSIEIDYSDAPNDGCSISTNTLDFFENPLASIFPNPAGNYLTIKNQLLQSSTIITVYDSQGKSFQKFTLSSIITDLNISSWPLGMYFFKITSEENSQTVKIIKTHF